MGGLPGPRPGAVFSTRLATVAVANRVEMSRVGAPGLPGAQSAERPDDPGGTVAR